jgi:hypothetical protein
MLFTREVLLTERVTQITPHQSLWEPDGACYRDLTDRLSATVTPAPIRTHTHTHSYRDQSTCVGSKLDTPIHLCMHVTQAVFSRVGFQLDSSTVISNMAQ